MISSFTVIFDGLKFLISSQGCNNASFTVNLLSILISRFIKSFAWIDIVSQILIV